MEIVYVFCRCPGSWGWPRLCGSPWGWTRFGLVGSGFSALEVLQSITVVTRCINHVESARPATHGVRAARRAILDQVRQPTSPASELARTMQAFPLGKALMEASRNHVAQSIEDDTATNALQLASATFESAFTPCFEDIENWKLQMRSQAAGADLGLINALFAHMGVFFTSAFGAIKKWGTASAHANLDFVVTNLENAMVMIRVGKYMTVDIYVELVGSLVPSLGDALLGSLRVPCHTSGAA